MQAFWTVNCLSWEAQGFTAEVFIALHCEIFFFVPVFDEWLFSWLPRAAE
jgi:hypothetical protein